MDSISSINKNGFKVFELIKSKPIVETSRSPEQKIKDDQEGIITVEMDEDFIPQFSSIDIFNNYLSIGARLKQEEIIIDETDYNEFKLLVEQFLNIAFVNRTADFKFIAKAVFDWMIDLHIKKTADMELYDSVISNIEKQVKPQHFNFIIKALKIQTQFQIGNCHFHQLTKEDSLKIFKHSSTEAAKNGHDMTPEEWDQMFDSFIDTPLASVAVFGVNSKCIELAKREIRLSVNSLKCFLFPEMLNRTTSVFDVDFDYRVYEKVEYLSHAGRFRNVSFNVELPMNRQPICIGRAEFERLMHDGLFLLHQFILSKRNTELYYELENAIIQFGSLSNFSNLYERIINLISFFETLIIPKNNLRAKGETILKNNVIPKLQIGNQDEMRIYVRRIYDIRDRYVHNRIELAIDMESFYNVTLCGLIFLLYCVDQISPMNTLEDLHHHFNISNGKNAE